MIFRARHLGEDRLFECYLAEQGGEPMEPPSAEHLADCAQCAARYSDLQHFMDRLRSEADTDLDARFPPERLRAQQQQIARRLEHLTHPARVISFPRHTPDHHAPAARPPVARWLVATAAAGLTIGIALGSFFYSARDAAERQTPALVSRVGPAAPPVVVTTAPALVSDTDFLTELEFALEGPRTRELVALDELTPHVLEIQYQVR